MSVVKKLVWLFVFLLAASAVAAGNFSVEFSPASQSINEHEIAQYNVTIFHDYSEIQFFEIYSPEVLWDIRTKDALQVPPNMPFTTTLNIQPLNINPGLYGVPINIKRTGTNEFKKALLYMEVNGPPSTTIYLPAIHGTAAIPASIDPREDVVITVNLDNQNRRNLSDLDVKVRSAVINQDFTTTLDPAAHKTEKFVVHIDPATAPQHDVLTVTIIANQGGKGFQFDLPPVEYSVRSYGQVTPTIQDTSAFLKTTKLIRLSNNANILIDEPFALPMPWYQRLITRSDPASRTENGALVWDVTLNVGQWTLIRVTTNYRPVAAVIILLAVILVLYYIFRSPLTMKKSATVVSTREGGISELKILLELKNRSGKPIHQTSVVDLVPRIAELMKEFDVGTLTPTKIIRHERRGTIIKYEVGDILPYEERVISYKVKSTLSILGGVSLPPAVSRFVTATGKERTTGSKAAKIEFLG